MDCKLPNKCWCKSCRKLYDKVRFQKIKDNRRKQINERKQKLRIWLRSLKEKACKDCGGHFHWSAMQFDHMRDKSINVADMIGRGSSKSTISKEIDKCELVCANCHAVRTFKNKY